MGKLIFFDNPIGILFLAPYCKNLVDDKRKPNDKDIRNNEYYPQKKII